VRRLLLQGNDYVIYAASCRLNAYHAHLSAARKMENFEELEVWDKMRFLLMAHGLNRPEERDSGTAIIQITEDATDAVDQHNRQWLVHVEGL
jgi:hypothetical protein